MRVKVLCLAGTCKYYLQVREVTRLHLGQDVYESGNLVCGGCGYDLLVGISVDKYLERMKEKT
jgi:hypothetical protein